jgi:L-alanine-DL-glutamate epimerase-like enolase superfamily enzyme
MKLIDICIREIGIPFAINFKHALATRTRTSAVIFEIITDDSIHGYGEGTPREYVTGESIRSTLDALKRIAEKIIGLELDPAHDPIKQVEILMHSLFNGSENTPSAKCAVELALLDAIGKITGKSILEQIGPQKTTAIDYSIVISDESPAATEKLLSQVKALDFRQVKIKVGNDMDADIQKLNLVRSILGDRIQLRIDPNSAWDLEEAVLKTNHYHDNFGVHIVEQPISAERRSDYPALLERIAPRIKIILDESICTLDDARWFIKNRGAAGFNLKISKHGGLLDTFKIYQLACENGFDCQLGCHVGETSILTAAGQIFAGLVDRLIAYEGAFGEYLLTHDIVRAPLQFGYQGSYRLDQLTAMPGLGLEIDAALLDKATARQFRIPEN